MIKSSKNCRGDGLSSPVVRSEKMIEQYQVEKWVWTDADFDVMSWHDSSIYAVAFYPENFEFSLDIDYIFKWIHPAENETYFKFWVAPATLVFEFVSDLKINIIDLQNGFEIDSIERTEIRKIEEGELAGKIEWGWTIETHQGEITFNATGYKQFIRQKPSFVQPQVVETEIRGNISFYRGRLDK